MKQMARVRKYFILLALIALIGLVLAGSFQLFSSRNESMLVVKTECGDVEVISDMNNSIRTVDDYLESNSIKLIIDYKTDQCGFLFINSDGREKFFYGSMTGIELLCEVSYFFNPGKLDKKMCIPMFSKGYFEKVELDKK